MLNALSVQGWKLIGASQDYGAMFLSGNKAPPTKS